MQVEEKYLWPEAVMRCWNSTLHNHLKKMGFLQTASDPCIYRSSGRETFLIGVYVDDIILAGKSERKMREVKEALGEKFDIKDLGKLHYFRYESCTGREDWKYLDRSAGIY